VVAHDLRLKAALAITWHVDGDGAGIGQHGLGAAAVAVVGQPGGLVLTGCVTQVVAHLGAHGALD